MAIADVLTPMSDEVGTFIERLGLDPLKVKRVVIDIDAASPMVTVHVEMLAATSSLEIITTSNLAPEIKIIDR